MALPSPSTIMMSSADPPNLKLMNSDRCSMVISPIRTLSSTGISKAMASLPLIVERKVSDQVEAYPVFTLRKKGLRDRSSPSMSSLL